MRNVVLFNEIFETMVYPAGEPHIRLRFLFHGFPVVNLHIIAEARNWNDLMQIKIADQILKNNGVQATFVIPYMPFGRHDRKNDNFEEAPILFAMGLLADIDIVTIDPHSDVSGIFPHFSQSEVVKLFETADLFKGYPVIAIPDAGAAKKAYSWTAGRDVVQCLKTRDTTTGKLSDFQVVNPELVKNRKVVIVDDICDGGGTFLGLATKLIQAGAYDLRLAVTHGLFTKGLGDLYSIFKAIYTLDIYEDSNHRLETVSTMQLISEGMYF